MSKQRWCENVDCTHYDSDYEDNCSLDEDSTVWTSGGCDDAAWVEE